MCSNQPGSSATHSNVLKSSTDIYHIPTGKDLNNLSYLKRIPILIFLDLPQLLSYFDINLGLIIRENSRNFIQFLLENFYLAVWNSETGQRSHLFTSSIFGEFKYELLAVLDRKNESDYKGKRIKRFDLFFDASLITNDKPGKVENEKYIISMERSLSVFQPDNTLFIHSQKVGNSLEVKELYIPSMLDTTNPNILIILKKYLENLREAYLKDEDITIQNYIDRNPFTI